MITAPQYVALETELIIRGYGDEIEWAEKVECPKTAEGFAEQTIYVIINSGMKWQVAVKIHKKVCACIASEKDIRTAFRHTGKVAAIEYVWEHRSELFECWRQCSDDVERLGFLISIPYIGAITGHHLARNLGMDLAKPDRHLQRLADRYETTPQAMCEELARGTGRRVGTVDVVLWRACNLGIIDEFISP